MRGELIAELEARHRDLEGGGLYNVRLMASTGWIEDNWTHANPPVHPTWQGAPVLLVEERRPFVAFVVEHEGSLDA